MKTLRHRLIVAALVLLIGVMVWLNWPDPTVSAVEKAGGVLLPLTTGKNNGRVALTFPDTFSDDDLVQMGAVLDKLRPVWIQLQGHQITGRSLAALERLDYLRGLTMSRTKVVDEDLRRLKAFPELHVLNLDASPITDRGLELLKELAGLQSLSIRGTAVSLAGIKKLQAARPDLVVLSNLLPDPEDD